MSWQQQPGDGAYDANAAHNAAGAPSADRVHPESEVPQSPPNVYRPYAENAPEYERYNDPAAAHGWQNAYDETRELPPVAPDAPDSAVPRPPAGSRRRARPRRRGVRLPRRAAVVAGSLGAVGVAVALVAGLGSGSSDGARDAGGSARPEKAPSASMTDGSVPPTSGPSGSAGPATGAQESSTPGATGSAASGRSAEATPSSTAAGGRPASDTPSAPVTTTAPGNSGGKPGRGHGRHPK
jgi:hypothetical protein